MLALGDIKARNAGFGGHGAEKVVSVPRRNKFPYEF